MPPINQQGSRTGLITALVAFVILFVVSTVFAFNFYGKYNQALQDKLAVQKNYAGYVSDANIQSSAVQAMVQAKAETPPHFDIINSPSVTALDVARQQRDGLQAVITGAKTDQTPSAVADLAAAALKDASTKLAAVKVKRDLSGGLTSAVTRLVDQVVADQRSLAQLTQQLTAAKAQVAQVTASVADVTATGDKAAKAAAQAAADALAQSQTSIESTNATLKQLQDDEAAAVKRNQDAAQQSANQVADAQRLLLQAQTRIQTYETRLGNRRAYVDDAAVRVSDGQLIRVPGNGVCYINLGYGTGVTNGLTFEVYDKLTGVPPIPPNVTGDEQLPVGKASIEITHVGPNSSECRIVHTEPGAVLTEGDVIENLVYDAHHKYNFFVFGSFDLANTGRPTTADTAVIQRLVTQWGGKLIDRVSPDTDFLVIGAEPVLPEFGKDDLTPENQDKLQKAQDALDKYQEVLAEARALHIPVLNQSRFLYYIGYFDQATR